MKKLLLITLFIAAVSHVKAQFEIKISPIPLLFGGLALSAEGAINESVGLDGDLYVFGSDFDFNNTFVGGNFSAKYYFDPAKGIDKFHVGIFAGVQESAPGLGFLIGYKWVSRKNIVFEIGAGIGRSFDGGALGYGKFHLGYRFPKKAKS